MKAVFFLMATMLVISCAHASQFPQSDVSASDAASWIQHVTPLPKSIRIASSVSVSSGNVVVTHSQPADQLVQQAAKELREAIGPNSGKTATDLKKFVVSLELGGPDADCLRELNNSDQSYRIIPGAGGLRLLALKPTGLYYAAKTLGQLIRARAAAEQLQMPLAEVQDWPDLAKRGMWGADTHVRIPWMSDLKLNLVSQISFLEVDSAGRGHARHKSGREQLSDVAPLHAVSPVPVVLHLEQVSEKGLFAAYPNLKAKGGREGTLCYSQPQIVDVLVDWYVDLARLPGVETVEQWLAENLGGEGGCTCSECSQHDRNMIELRVVLDAWKKAREKSPGLKLSVLTSEETAASNEKIFAALPEGCHAWYYHSLLTYSTSRNPMVIQSVADYAAKGGSIGTAPSLCSNVNFPGPFTGPQFVHARMNELVDKKLSGVLAYPSPGIAITKFNVEAMAEWSWNAKGRSAREFAVSWAVREKLDDPALFADWCEANGTVAWDVYGSCWPEYQKRRNPKPVAEALVKRMLLTLEEANRNTFRGPWGDFREPGQFAANVRLAAKAVDLARKMGKPEYEFESRVVQGYMDSLNALWELNQIVTAQGIAASDREKARGHFEAYISGLQQAADALPKWAGTVTPRGDGKDLVSGPLEVIAKLTDTIRKAAKDLGVPLGAK